MSAASSRPAEPRLPLAARASVAWVAVGVVLTTATQLRVPGLPVGIGETLLAVWIALRLALLSQALGVGVPRAARPILWFWFVSVPLLIAGFLSQVLLRIPIHGSAYHDSLAFAFCAFSVSLFLLQTQLAQRARLAAGVMLATATAGLFPLLVIALRVPAAGPFEFWVAGIFGRFQGWATNPNQIALLMVPTPFIGLYLAGGTRGRRRLGWLAVTTCAGAVGVATLSNGLMAAWAVCLPAVAVVAAWRYLARPTRSILRGGVLWGALPVFLLTLGAAVAAWVLMHAARAAGGLSSSGEGQLRYQIWSNAMKAIAASPVVGLGPGAHAGIDQPFSGFEVHNTFLDWATATGALGVIAYCALLGWAAWRAWRARQVELLAALAAVTMFSLFHFVLRHPSYWFALLVVAYGAPAPATAPRRVPAPRAGPVPEPALP